MARTPQRSTGRRLALLGLGLAAATVAASCASPTDNNTRSATAGLPDTLQSLEAETWVLDTADTTPTIRTDATITLSFDEDRLSGQGPCNAYHAAFDIEGDDELEIGPIAATQRACDADLTKAEAAYFAALEEVDEADTTDPARLVLEGDDDVSLAFDRLDLDDALPGTWIITTLNTGDALTGPIEGTEATLSFDADGALAANGGCNPMATTWELDESAITIGNAAQGMKACPDPEGVMAQEAALAKALDDAVRVEVTDQLTLFDDEDRTLVIATKQPG